MLPGGHTAELEWEPPQKNAGTEKGIETGAVAVAVEVQAPADNQDAAGAGEAEAQ